MSNRLKLINSGKVLEIGPDYIVKSNITTIGIGKKGDPDIVLGFDSGWYVKINGILVGYPTTHREANLTAMEIAKLI